MKFGVRVLDLVKCFSNSLVFLIWDGGCEDVGQFYRRKDDTWNIKLVDFVLRWKPLSKNWQGMSTNFAAAYLFQRLRCVFDSR